jgi:hypothetical protein
MLNRLSLFLELALISGPDYSTVPCFLLWHAEAV